MRTTKDQGPSSPLILFPAGGEASLGDEEIRLSGPRMGPSPRDAAQDSALSVPDVSYSIPPKAPLPPTFPFIDELNASSPVFQTASLSGGEASPPPSALGGGFQPPPPPDQEELTIAPSRRLSASSFRPSGKGEFLRLGLLTAGVAAFVLANGLLLGVLRPRTDQAATGLPLKGFISEARPPAASGLPGALALNTASAPAPPAPSSPAMAPAAAAAAAAPAAPAPAPSPQAAPPPAASKPAPPPAPLRTAAAPPVAQTPPVAPAPTPAAGAEVQIGAFNSPALSNAAWSHVRAGLGAEGANKSLRVEPVQKGALTLYRTIVGGFASRAAAVSFCQTLKAKEEACFVRP